MPLTTSPKFFLSEGREFPEGTILKIWHTTESEETLSALFPAAAAEASERLSAVTAPHRRLEILVAHILFRLALPDGAHLAHLPSGRPVAEGADLHVSITHSHGYIALALSPAPIGIDFETWSPRALRISDKFLTAGEKALLGKEGDAGTDAGKEAVRLWAAKEAAFKLWDAADTTVHEDILLQRTRSGALRAFHTKNPVLRADICFPESGEALSGIGAFAVARFPLS
ncbi:MAG: 4'-phosphopantetheinyl transferase superfamily protein [Alloprevotella sp.]|nr:4'-phosphopantetheinyl transferase superfamily protein [Alloprevotella sp.]MBR1652055.1 4'-phosphopantetheinyl transferase superfamily protein [Alloprevotella sp.]